MQVVQALRTLGEREISPFDINTGCQAILYDLGAKIFRPQESKISEGRNTSKVLRTSNQVVDKLRMGH